jgi:hypothetical protein
MTYPTCATLPVSVFGNNWVVAGHEDRDGRLETCRTKDLFMGIPFMVTKVVLPQQ